ncbi:MAG: hypothetical protein KDJ20_19335, partial [Hyphomicrobiales bacterium]|nr:hypothetical protein [Hyphomicrobiales bacterium]
VKDIRFPRCGAGPFERSGFPSVWTRKGIATGVPHGQCVGIQGQSAKEPTFSVHFSAPNRFFGRLSRCGAYDSGSGSTKIHHHMYASSILGRRAMRLR